jgi:hypothetical protein
MSIEHLERGIIYVYRTCNGAEEALRLDRQYHYREWVGCWSAI